MFCLIFLFGRYNTLLKDNCEFVENIIYSDNPKTIYTSEGVIGV
jgi:hypothetical protein